MSAAEEMAAQAAFKKAVRLEKLKEIAALLEVHVDRLYEDTNEERNAQTVVQSHDGEDADR